MPGELRTTPPSPLTIGSLFSGIGGLELGLERAGLGPVLWQCEIDPFCRDVLAKHWPNVERFEDVVQRRNYPRVDLICGGFPCQGNSSAGKRRGLADPRSGLWFEFRRIVGELRPRFVIVENVTSGKKLWLPTVRENLEALGYRTRAFDLSAFDVGAPHLRRRVFVVADSRGVELREQSGWCGGAGWEDSLFAQAARETRGVDGDANGEGQPALAEHEEVAGVRRMASGASAWAAPPEFRGVDDGVPRRLDRLRALGNAVVPQCAEAIGRVIQELRSAA